MYTIEFQKRGLPHAHILAILEPEDKPRSVDDIDSIVCAEIPDPNEQPLLHDTVTRCMLHGPCGRDNPSPCMKDGKYSKHYPRAFSATTTMDDNSYPVYRRPNNGRTFRRGNSELDNRWVVPYNPYLSLKYDAHINVEIATSVTSVKYLYKYVYKGGDRALAEIRTQPQPQTEKDEPKLYVDGRYISAPEAADGKRRGQTRC